MSKALLAIDALLKEASPETHQVRFFKTGPGEYAAHDKFLGIPTPKLRAIGKTFSKLPLSDIETLLKSPYNEKRLLALFILVDQYKENQEMIYAFYKTHLAHVNNWNLVDSSAHLILGAHLLKRDRTELITLSDSSNLWARRVAIVATWAFIRKGDLEWTFKLAEKLFNDKEDLMHKAVGWMLREAGKKDAERLKDFLNRFAPQMPRTMLRYSIERLTPEERQRLTLR